MFAWLYTLLVSWYIFSLEDFVGILVRVFLVVHVNLLVSWYVFLVVHFNLLVSWYVFLVVNLAVNLHIVSSVQ